MRLDLERNIAAEVVAEHGNVGKRLQEIGQAERDHLLRKPRLHVERSNPWMSVVGGIDFDRLRVAGDLAVVHQHDRAVTVGCFQDRTEALGTLEREEPVACEHRADHARQRHRAFELRQHWAGVAGRQRSQREKRPGYFAQAADKASLTIRHSGADSRWASLRCRSPERATESRARPRCGPSRQRGNRGLPGAIVPAQTSFPGIPCRRPLRRSSAWWCVGGTHLPGRRNQCACMSMVMGALRPWAVLLAEID